MSRWTIADVITLNEEMRKRKIKWSFSPNNALITLELTPTTAKRLLEDLGKAKEQSKTSSPSKGTTGELATKSPTQTIN